MKLFHLLRTLITLTAISLLVAACNNGGGSSGISASFTATPATGKAPLPVTFDATASKPSSGSIVEYSWSFGDGQTAVGPVAPSHTYTATGSFTVTLTVKDSAGKTASNNKTIEVTAQNILPVAEFSATKQSDNAPAIVDLDASASSDSDGTITAYAWEFGDGHTGSGQKLSHQYVSQGDYTVRLTVTDSDGGTNSKEMLISIGGPNQPPVAHFVTAALPGLQVAFNASTSSDSDGQVSLYQWSFGDGQSSQELSSPNTTHTYASEGTYTVSLIVKDNDGASSEPFPAQLIVSNNTARIVIIGDSIAQGRPENPSFRYELWKKLVDSAKAFDLVGSYNVLATPSGGNPGEPCSLTDCPDYPDNTSHFDQDHEAVWGLRADQVYDNLNNNAKGYGFDIALIHLGTNDLLQAQGPADALQDLTNIIARLRENNPNVKIALAQIIPVSSTSNFAKDLVTYGDTGINGLIAELNTGIAGLADANTSSPVVIVDQHTGFTDADFQTDGVHPNTSGEQKLATRWYDNALAGFLGL